MKIVKSFIITAFFITLLFLFPIKALAVTATGSWSSGDEYVTCGGTINCTFPAEGGSASGTYSGICNKQNIKLGGRFSGNFTGGWDGTFSGSFNGWHSFTVQGNKQSFDVQGSWRGSIRKDGTATVKFTSSSDFTLDGDVYATFSVDEFNREYKEYQESLEPEEESVYGLKGRLIEERAKQPPGEKTFYMLDYDQLTLTTEEQLRKMPPRFDADKMANRGWPRFYFGEGKQGWLLDDDEDIGYFEEMVVDAILAKNELLEKFQGGAIVAYDAFIDRFSEEAKKNQVFKTEDGTLVWVGQDGTLVEVLEEDFFDKKQRQKLGGEGGIVALGDGRIVIDNSGNEKNSPERFVFLTSKENTENKEDDTEVNEEKTSVSKLIFGNKSIVEYVFDKDTLETEVKVYEGEVTVYEFDPTDFSKKTLISLKPGESLKVSLADYAETGDEALKKGTFDINEKNEGVEKIKRIKKQVNRPAWTLLVGGIAILVVLVAGTFLIFKKLRSKK